MHVTIPVTAKVQPHAKCRMCGNETTWQCQVRSVFVFGILFYGEEEDFYLKMQLNNTLGGLVV